MINPDRHSPKKGAPDYRTEWGKEKSERQKLERLLTAKEDNEESLINKIEQQQQELKDIKSDYRKLQNIDCRQCLNQERLIKENKEMFKWLMAMAGITVITLILWWLK